jgi:hypothetical protein
MIRHEDEVHAYLVNRREELAPRRRMDAIASQEDEMPADRADPTT